MKKSNIDKVIEKRVCLYFRLYYSFLIYTFDIILIGYFWSEMIINIFVLLDILSNNGKF